MADKFIRKPVVFNRESEWHMEILKRINKESDNFSGYVMSILKGHFDTKIITNPEPKPQKKELPLKVAPVKFNFNGQSIKQN